MQTTGTSRPALYRALTFLAFLSIATAGWGRVVYVNRNASGAIHDGASWSTACLTVQSGINAAVSGDEIWVAASTPAAPAYFENVVIQSGESIYGGFAGTETSRALRSLGANPTVLNGGGKDAITALATGVTIDGLTICNSNYGIFGGGSDVTVNNCILTGNNYGVNGVAKVSNFTASGNSRGIDYAAVVTNSTITRNTYGVASTSRASTVRNCIIAYNDIGVSCTPDTILSHNDVFGSITVDYRDVPDPTGSNGNISVDPHLTNPYHDIHLQPDSPCIDAGDDAVVLADWTDIDGQPRIIGPHVDIGSDESDGTLWPNPARIWYATTTGDDANDGTGWSTAKKTIGAALAQARGIDEVWVARGTYNEALSFSSGVEVYGGFAGTETSRDQRDFNANLTVLDAMGINSKGVVTLSLLGTVLDGFTIQNAADGVTVNGTANITNCIITKAACGIRVVDTAIVSRCNIIGGSWGVYTQYGTAFLSDCVMSGSTYGVYSYFGRASLDRCIVKANTYGVFASDLSTTTYGPVSITNSTFNGNTYGVYARRTAAPSARVLLTSSTFGGNGVGVYFDTKGGVSVINSILANNSTGVSCGAATSGITLSHNDVYGNITVNYKNMPDPTGTNGNISVDPRLSNPYHDTHLQPDSPCIDAGDDTAVQAAWTDIDGQPRVIGAHVDIGSDESDGTEWNVRAQTWFVAPSGSDANDGMTWSTAKSTIAAALAQSQGADEVWVAKGTYAEAVSVPAGVGLYGGFAGAETARAQRDPITNPVVMVWNLIPDMLALDGAGIVLDGFTLQSTNSAIDVNGAARIDNCNISGGSAGVTITDAATLIHCTISGSYGVYAPAGTAVLVDCIIKGGSYGVNAVNGATRITNCQVSGGGYGIYVSNGPQYGPVTISNCTISGNTSYGLYVSGLASVANCIVSFNATGVYRSGSSSVVTLSHNNVFGNTSANYKSITDPTGTNGNTSSDPLFVSRTSRDYHLLPGSPCIDSGDDSAVAPGDKDLDGKPRIIGAHVDIGAYESGTVFYTVADAAKALRIAAGLEAAPPEFAHWDVEAPNPAIDMLDVIRIARMANGFDPNR